MGKSKDNPVPSLDDIQVIEDLLEVDGSSEFDNDPRDAYFNGVRAGIQTYFEHYPNGVETNKEQPLIPNDYRLIHQSDEEIIFRKIIPKKCDCANQAKSCSNLSCNY